MTNHMGKYVIKFVVALMISFSYQSLVTQRERLCLQCRRCGLNPWVEKILWWAIIHGISEELDVT